MHSCSTALANLTNKWLTAINEGDMCGVIFLDFKKAFDLVDHDLLLQKLFLYTKNPQCVSFFKSFLSNRVQRVYVHGSMSSEGIIKSGVPQGSVLGPVLFCLFINDLPLHSVSSCCDMLADDTTLHATAKSISSIQTSLQNSLVQVNSWCSNNDMVLNPVKTFSMVIATRQKHQLAPLKIQLNIHGKSVEQVRSHRLLGVLIDDRMCWDSHVNYVTTTISRKVFLLSKLCHLVDTQACKLFFDAHIKSHVSYASIIWDGCSDALKKKMTSLYRRCVKLMLPSTTVTTEIRFKTLGLLPLEKQFLFNKAVFVYKAVTNTAPTYIISMFPWHKASYCTSRMYQLQQRHPRLDLFKTSICYAGASLWNSLPLSIRTCHSLSSFKRTYYDFLLEGIT